MSRSRRIMWSALLSLLSLAQFSRAGFGTHFSAGGAPSLNHYQRTESNTWTAIHPPSNSYAPPPLSPSHYPSTYLPQKEQQLPPAPLTRAGGLHLSPLPTQSKFQSQQQPIHFTSAGHDSFFYSARDQAYYKVTKVNLSGAKGSKEKAGYSPPPPHYTTTTPPPIHYPPPTPQPTSPPYAQRPTYRIKFHVTQTGPAEGCPGGGSEAMNPALTPYYGAYPASAGCPPEHVGGPPQIGAPVPVIPDTDQYSSSPSSSSFPSSQSQFGGDVSGGGGVPSTTYGAPSQYGPPPPKYDLPVRPTGDGTSGIGAMAATAVQTNGVYWEGEGNSDIG